MSILNPSTYLDFVQRAAQECRFANVPSTVVNQVGHALDVCLWVNESWKEIQNRRDDWGWMKANLSFPTVGGTTTYTPVANVESYRRDSFRYYLTSAGVASEVPLPYVSYDQWRDGYQIGSLQTVQTVPQVITITPARALAINTPLVGYTIVGEYYRAMTQFAADGDTTDLPQQYCMLIVYGAMMKYAVTKNASEVYSAAEKEYDKLMTKLESRYLPEVEGASALGS